MGRKRWRSIWVSDLKKITYTQTLFVHYIEYSTISNVKWLVNPQNGSWVLFTKSRNSLFWRSLYQGLSVIHTCLAIDRLLLGTNVKESNSQEYWVFLAILVTVNKISGNSGATNDGSWWIKVPKIVIHCPISSSLEKNWL